MLLVMLALGTSLLKLLRIYISRILLRMPRVKGCRISSTWTRARAATSALGIGRSFDDEWRRELMRNEITIVNRKKIFRTLRQAYHNEESMALANSKHQGKTYHCFSKSKVSSHFHRDGNFTRFAEWRFVHRARLGTVPLNVYRFDRPDSEKRCRRCRGHVETLPNVLKHCRPYLPAIIRRHNNIVNRIKKTVGNRWKVLRENQPVGMAALRPDFLLRKRNDVMILDVTSPYENGSTSFNDARRLKEDKYGPLASELRRK